MVQRIHKMRDRIVELDGIKDHLQSYKDRGGIVEEFKRAAGYQKEESSESEDEIIYQENKENSGIPSSKAEIVS